MSWENSNFPQNNYIAWVKFSITMIKIQVKHQLLFLLLLICSLSLNATNLIVRGQVKGLNSTERKAKQIVLEKTKITVKLDDKTVLVKNTLKGVYTFEVNKPGLYTIEVSCKDYNSKTVFLDLNDIPELEKGQVLELTDLDFLLLSAETFPDDISTSEVMGTLTYNSYKNAFQIDVNNTFRFKNDRHDISLRLLRRTITYIRDANNKKVTSGYLRSNPARRIQSQPRDSAAIDSMIKRVKAYREVEKKLDFKFENYSTIEEIDLGYIQLDSARMKLDSLMQNAVTREDSLMISKMEVQISLAELNLKMAKETITNQEEQLANQKRISTIYTVASIILLIILIGVIWLYLDRVKMNKELKHKNQLILDGINYAQTIQSSFLKSKEEIQKFIPEFSLFFKPRDIVSGDVYWANEVQGKLIVAAIDCTGHGVPGAFISMIANTLLNEIINTKKILEPGKILEELHLSFVDILQQKAGEKQAQDGMDMSLLVIDKAGKKIQFGGAKNHMYEINKGELNVVKADFNSVGGRALRAKDGFNKSFNTREVELKPDSVYYMFSDGFVDQFGGEENKKFNLPQFRELLIQCAKLSPKDQEIKMQNAFESWKGENEQLDDVLVIGIKV